MKKVLAGVKNILHNSLFKLEFFLLEMGFQYEQNLKQKQKKKNFV